MVRSCYLVIIIKSYKGLELVSSLQHCTKNMSEMFVNTAHLHLTEFHFDSTLDSKEIIISVSSIM